jgi:RNA polymerase-binding transcription factor DksA
MEKREVAKGDSQNSKYRKWLLEIHDRLLDQIQFHAGDTLKRTPVEASSDLSAYQFHMADVGTETFDQEFAVNMISNEQEAVYEVNEALKRLDQGTYGICEMCGKPIPEKRLEAVPWARFDANCQSEFEKMHPKQNETYKGLERSERLSNESEELELEEKSEAKSDEET